MARGNIPVVQLRRLRGELRRARESAGLTQKQVAEGLSWSLSKVIRLETGPQSISTADVMALAFYYGMADTDHINSLLAITRAKEQDWWDEYRDVYPTRFVEFLAYEALTTSIRHFQPLAVPGLLQTEHYARALLASGQEPDAAERAVQVRLRRQEILHRENGPDAQFIFEEAVIHRFVGSQEVMVEQLRRLRELHNRPRVSIRIVPFTAAGNAAMNGSFAILESSPDSEHSSDIHSDCVVNLEPATRFEMPVYDDPETVNYYIETFGKIRKMALPKEQTDQVLAAKIESMRVT